MGVKTGRGDQPPSTADVLSSRGCTAVVTAEPQRLHPRTRASLRCTHVHVYLYVHFVLRAIRGHPLGIMYNTYYYYLHIYLYYVLCYPVQKFCR